jgi:hypothetical protein
MESDISLQVSIEILPVVVLCIVIFGILGTTISDFSTDRVISGILTEVVGFGKKKY